MRNIKYIFTVVVALMATTTLPAQTTYNDTVRTNTWSVYVEGGISNFHGVDNHLWNHADRTSSPDLNIGVDYNLKPWVRLGINVGYTMLKGMDESIATMSWTENNYPIGDRLGTLTTEAHRLQSTNTAHVLGADINAEFNIMEFWHERKPQWFNLYAGVGVGYMHGWHRNAQTWSYMETGIAEGAGYANKYTHAYMNSRHDMSTLNALYIPLSLSAEFDVQRWLTLGVTGEYKYIPTKADYSPKGIYSIGGVVRYNFVASPLKQLWSKIAGLKQQLFDNQQACDNDKQELQRMTNEKINLLRKEMEEWKLQAKAARAETERVKKSNAALFFDNNSAELSAEANDKLKQVAEQLKVDKELSIIIVGSANTTGTMRHNQKLSDNRIDVVKQQLMNLGVDASQIKTELSLGERGMTEDEKCRRVLILNSL